MLYKIIQKKLDIPIQVGILTDKGLITNKSHNFSDVYYINEKWYITSQLNPISISLEIDNEVNKPKRNDYVFEDIFIQDLDKYINSLNMIEYLSEEQQLILLDKLNQGISVIDDIELSGIIRPKLIKCYCGHTTMCDCGEQTNEEILIELCDKIDNIILQNDIKLIDWLRENYNITKK